MAGQPVSDARDEVTIPFPVPDRPGRTPSKSDVFRAMIAWEVMNGSLTPSRRRRLVRYAAQLGLTARQAGELIRACVEAQDELEPKAPDTPTLTFVPPAMPTSPSQRWAGMRPIVLMTLAVLAAALLLYCLRA